MIGTDIREDTPGYQPPEGADEQPPWVLALKMALSCALVALAVRLIGFPNPSTGVISAAFLVSNGPVATARSTVWRVLSLFVGGTLGLLAAYSGQAAGKVPFLWFPLFGAVSGWAGSLKPDMIYLIVIAVVVAAQGVAGDQPIPEVATEVGVQIAVSCLIAPAVVWGVEWVRARKGN